MADIGNKMFEQMSGGAFKGGDFADSIKLVSESMGGLYSIQQQYESVIKNQVSVDTRALKTKKASLSVQQAAMKTSKKELGIVGKMLPWKNKELKLLKEEVKVSKTAIKLATQNVALLKKHNTAMGFMMGGMKKGAQGAALGIGKLVGKLGAAGVAFKVFKVIVDQLLQVNKFTADISKSFAISGDAASKFVGILAGAERETAKFLLNMSDLLPVAEELVMQMGGLNKVTSKAVEVSGKLQKAFGLTAKQAADVFTTMHINMGMTAAEVESANASMQLFAEKNGAVASKVMRDLASSAALTAMSMGKSMEDVGEMSIKAQKLGTTFEKLKEGGKRFILDFEGSSESIAKINNMLGTNMRADVMAINAETGNWLENQMLILDAAEAYQESGKISTIIESELEQFGGERMDDLLRMVKLRKAGNLDLVKEHNERKKIDKILRSGMDIWSRIKGIVMGVMQPALTYIGRLLDNQIRPIMEDIEKYADGWSAKLQEAMGGADDFATKFGRVISVLAQPLVDLFKMAARAAMDVVSEYTPWWMSIGSEKPTSGEGAHAKRARLQREKATREANAVAPAQATGNVFSRPTYALIGEENRSEVVIPTERIRRGLPVSGSVAAELSSIGVPGFAIGGATTRRRAAADSVTTNVKARTEANAMYAAASDPAAIRRRTRDFEMAANAHREELRRMHRTEHAQQLAVLDAEETHMETFGTTMNNFTATMGPSRISGHQSFAGNLANKMFEGGIESLRTLGTDLLNDFKTGQLQVNSKIVNFAFQGLQMLSDARGLYQGGQAAFQKGGYSGLAQFGLRDTIGGQQLRAGISSRVTAFQARGDAAIADTAAMKKYGTWAGAATNKELRGNYVKQMGGVKGMAKGAAMGGLQAGADTLMAGGSLKDAVTAGGASFASGAVGMAATAGLIGLGVPAPIAQIAGSAVGKVVVGGAMKALGIGSYKKKDKRRKAMGGFRKAVNAKNLMSFRNSGALLKSFVTPEGEVNESSKRATMTEMANILSTAGVKSSPGEVESLMWALIGLNNADVAAQLPINPQQVIQGFDEQLQEAKGGQGQYQSAPRRAGRVNPYATEGGGGMRSDGSYGGSGGGGGGGGEFGFGNQSDQRLMLHELREMRRDNNNRRTDLRVDMDGTEVARLVTEGQENLATG